VKRTVINAYPGRKVINTIHLITIIKLINKCIFSELMLESNLVFLKC